ncbi:HET-domain-containing protein [Cadophora sp. DSE1049]|nr:HET-domain-containing protein [Cadophora sp. DSE1049]
MDRYQYKQLSPRGKQIRLVVVYPRVPSRPEEIRVTIFETPLEAERRLWPTFMALSYVWGDADNRRDLIVVDSKDGIGPDHLTSPKRLSVTANLMEALTYLPWSNNHRILWIDAICINQEDMDERAQQVKLMAEIYTSASHVLAWLGPPTHDSNFAMNLLHRISDSIDVDWKILPDYRKPVVWVYQELLLAEMAVTDRADLLSECLMPKASPSTTPPWHPFWVPNWTLTREWDLIMTEQCADGQSAVAAFCATEDQGTLRLKGVLVATIFDTLEFPPLFIGKKENENDDRNDNVAEQPRPLPPGVAFIQEIATKINLSDTAHYHRSQGSTVLEALCYAFSGGGHLTDHISEQVINTQTPSMAQFRRFVKFALEYKQDDLSAREREFDTDLKADVKLCSGQLHVAGRERALLVTREGYVGAGSAAAQPGDKIAVMLGCMRPLVLRPQKRLGDFATTSETDHDTNTYTVVGPCNAHGEDRIYQAKLLWRYVCPNQGVSVSSSTTMPDSCRSLSFTGCSDLYRSLISLRSSLRFRCFSLYNRLMAFWSLSSFRPPTRALDRSFTRLCNFTIYEISFTDAVCSSVSFRGRRGSIERLMEHANRIRSF